ncbi:MAG: acetyltransferase [Cyclobacteriaceae bacterium]|nr:acetyltransferase [Cyclobacteriaceae bacterium]MDH5251480.1 acetyltransferase [Cyclobacteriaceae bacterium]
MREPLLIYGAGGFGREVLSLVNAIDGFQASGFLDDGVPKDTVVNGMKVLGGLEVLESFDHIVNLVLAIGDPAAKALLVSKLDLSRIRFPILRHPSVIIQDEATVKIGVGSILCAGSIFTTDIRIGDHVLVNLNCTIGHDTSIGHYTSLMPGVNVAGGVAIGDAVLIGSGSNILNQVRIGDKSIVGMGSVVIHNVEAGATVVGVPARGIGHRV